MTVQFVDSVPQSVPSTAKRGRPEIFSDEVRAALDSNPGKAALLQTGVKGRSRLTALRNRYKGQPYTFTGVVTERGTKTTDDGKTVPTEVLSIYVERIADTPAAEAEVPAAEAVEPAEAEVTAPVVSEAEQAERDAEFEAAAPAPAKRSRGKSDK